MSDVYVLVLDVGGTFTKIAVVKNKAIVSKKILKTEELQIEDIKRLVADYKKSKRDFSAVMLACAGPVREGKCKLANANHSFDEKLLGMSMGTPVKLINDLEAAAYYLRKENKNSLIIGLGTGLGVSLIDENGKTIPSEEGHTLIDKELFFSVPELKSTIIQQYENLLGAKKNILLKLLKKEEKEITLKETDKDGKKDRFTEIYMQILNSFIQKIMRVHANIKIKKIIFVGGISSNNKKFIEKYSIEIKKRFKKETKIIDDEFTGVKGALAFYHENRKAYEYKYLN